MEASQAGRHNKAKASQWLLTHSFCGKALSRQAEETQRLRAAEKARPLKKAGPNGVLANSPPCSSMSAQDLAEAWTRSQAKRPGVHLSGSDHVQPFSRGNLSQSEIDYGKDS